MKHPDLDELYDWEADPFEMDSRVDDPAMRGAKADLLTELGRLQLCIHTRAVVMSSSANGSMTRIRS